MFGQNLSPYERLNVILSDKVMRFNPYSVSDSVLLECAERGYILPPPSFTQMAVFHFQDIQKVERNFSYEAIFFTIGSSPVRYHLAIGSLIHSFTHHHTLRPTHVKIGGKNLTNYRMVEKMQVAAFLSVTLFQPLFTSARDMSAIVFTCLGGVCKIKLTL